MIAMSSLIDHAAPHTLRPLALAAAFIAATAQAGGLTIDVQHTPSVLPTPGGRALVYELGVRNFAAECARIVDVRTSSEGVILRRYQGSAIARNLLVYDAAMKPLPNPAPGQDALHPVDVPANGGAVVYLYLTLDNNLPLPDVLHHEIDTTACSAGATSRSTASNDAPVSRAAPVVVDLPFRGAGWVAGDSPNDFGIHRRTLIPVRDANGTPIVGQFHVPERFAIDWVRIDPQARRANGPIDRNDSYLAWGEPVIAVADGVISALRDGMPESTPPNNPPNPTVEMAAGNYVMQSIGDGHYAFYAHLQPGSLRVQVGQPVVRGQVLGLLGNSGNSSEPHLHFHISNSNDPLMSEGLPYVFRHYALTGQVGAIEDGSVLYGDYAGQAPTPKFWLMPQNNAVLDADPQAYAPWAWVFPIQYPAQ